MQIILVKYMQLFCVTLFFSNNVKCDQLLLKNDNEDRQIYGISACTGRCMRNSGNLTLEQCYEDCVNIPSEEIRQPKKIYRNLEVKFLCRDDSSFVIEIADKNFEHKFNLKGMTEDRNGMNKIDDNDTFIGGDNDDNDNDYEIEINENFTQNNITLDYIEDSNRTLSNEFNNINSEIQFQMYVIKIHEEDRFPIEKQFYLTNSNLIRIDNLQPNTKYHISATVVFPNNEYSLIADGITYSTLKKKYIPKEISNVNVRYMSGESRNFLSAEITWTPASDQTCYYDILWHSPEIMNGFDLSPIEIRDIEQLYTYTIRNLSFGTKYQVAVRGKNTKDLTKESDLVWHSIMTPTCLDWYLENSICPPLKPQNLSVHEECISENLYSLNISWERPYFLPDFYSIKIHDLSGNGQEPNIIEVNVSKEYSSVILPEVKIYGLDFGVNLTAVSYGGTASSTVLVSVYNFVRIPDKFGFMKFTFIISIIVIVVGVILVAILFIFLRRAKINRLKQRCRYLEELKDNSLTSNIEILEKNKNNDTINSMFEHLQQSLQAKLYINDEKEIERENLKLFEILGEGAFGLVRRGILKVSETETIEVATKTLKDQPSCDDVKAFRREIDVMKSVGYHPNIVSIIGHCTKNINELMLVTEYCALGNLQNFLTSELRYMNDMTKTKIRKIEDNVKQGGNIFNYNNSLAYKHQIQYKSILVTANPPSTVITTLQNNEDKKFESNGKIVPENMVINKGYDLNGTCTNSCKCEVDVIMKDQENHNGNDEKSKINENFIKPNEYTTENQNAQQRICQIEIKNCDCADIGRKLQDSMNPAKDQSVTDDAEEKHDGKTENAAILTKNRNFYGLNNNTVLAITSQDSPSRTLPSRRTLTSADLLLMAKQIAVGMEFLAKNKIVHRDLAARNVLVCDDYTVKIADFGLSRDVYQENIYKKTGNGKLPIRWLALESITHQIYTSQSDVWAYGILLYEIVTLGGTPYPSIKNNRILELIKSGYRMEKPKTCSEELYNLMSSCWLTNPSNRPTFTEIIKIIDEFLMNRPDDHIFDLITRDHSHEHRKPASSEESYLKPISLQ